MVETSPVTMSSAPGAAARASRLRLSFPSLQDDLMPLLDQQPGRHQTKPSDDPVINTRGIFPPSPYRRCDKERSFRGLDRGPWNALPRAAKYPRYLYSPPAIRSGHCVEPLSYSHPETLFVRDLTLRVSSTPATGGSFSKRPVGSYRRSDVGGTATTLPTTLATIPNKLHVLGVSADGNSVTEIGTGTPIPTVNPAAKIFGVAVF